MKYCLKWINFFPEDQLRPERDGWKLALILKPKSNVKAEEKVTWEKFSVRKGRLPIWRRNGAVKLIVSPYCNCTITNALHVIAMN